VDTRSEIREFLTSRRTRDFYLDSDRAALDTVAVLRSAAGRDPYDRDLSDLVGELNLNFERLDLAADSGLTIFTYTAEPGTRDEEALRLLGSWAATYEQATVQ
jgi:MmyB-like transcription regulator ligand binding domain